MLKAVRSALPEANIATVDYDPGASEVNQLNRIKLMMSSAHKNLELEMAGEDAKESKAVNFKYKSVEC